MLQRVEQARGLPFENGETPRRLDLVDIYAFLKSNRRIIAGWIIIAVSVALVYALTATPLYSAIADLTIDSRQIQLFQGNNNNNQVVGDNALDSAQVESEVEVLRSESIAQSVIKDMKLTDDPEFVDTRRGTLMWLLSTVFGLNEDPRVLSDAERERIAIAAFAPNLSVRRIGLTYVLEISYRSSDPQKAARIANAVADAYITDQLNTKYQAAKRASLWLQDRIAELRDQSTAAARAVQDYKQKNNIVSTGAETTRGGERGTLADLQLQELNTQMIAATAATAEAKARFERIEQVLKSPEPGDAVGTVTDTLHDEVITRLRTKYLDDRERVAEWTTRLGPSHLAVINLRNEMLELDRSIVDELQRIAQTYKSDFEIAKVREDSLRGLLGTQIQEAGATGQAQVDLMELESASQTYHTIFENFLEKYTQAVQEQSFPISDARVITAASPPLHKSYPRTTLTALLGLIVGLSVGLGHSLVLKNFDRAVRRPRDVEERLGLESLSLVPLVPRGQSQKEPDKASAPAATTSAAIVRASERNGDDLISKVLDDPFSHFSEGLRTAKTALDIMALTRPMRCIGVISALPGEGKSTISVNLANLFASGGHSTLLVDGDLRNPQLSRQLGVGAKCGLIEVIAGTSSLAEATLAASQNSMRFLPAVLQQRIANTGDLLASERMQAVLSEARREFQHVIVDLPPLGPISDARAMSPLIDAFVLVVNWGRTRFDVVQEALNNFGIASDKIVGVVLNKVNYRELRNMDAYSHGYYYNKHYSKYGYAYTQED